jgi:hypothetical protein
LAVLKPLDQCPHAQALAVNAEGLAVGSSYSAKIGQAVVWQTPENPQGLPVASAASDSTGRIPSIATAVNDRGQIVGSYGGTATIYPRACRWANSSQT